MDGLPDVHLEAGVVPRHPLAGIAVDGAHVALLSFTPPESLHRRLGALADLPAPVWVGPRGVDDSLRAGAAPHVVALALTHRAAPEELPTTWLRIVPMLVYEEFAIESQPKHPSGLAD